MSMGFIIISMIAVVAMITGAVVAAALGRRPSGTARLDPASLAEIGRLRDDVDRLSGELHRLQEEQSFIVNLLGDAERKRLLEGPPKDG